MEYLTATYLRKRYKAQPPPPKVETPAPPPPKVETPAPPPQEEPVEEAPVASETKENTDVKVSKMDAIMKRIAELEKRAQSEEVDSAKNKTTIDTEAEKENVPPVEEKPKPKPKPSFGFKDDELF